MTESDVTHLDVSNPCDVTLVVKDGEEFKAHRQVLSEACPFFEKLLTSDMKESKEGVVRLETITKHQMADILEFIYTGHVNISSQENAENLIAAADFLLLPNVKSIASKFLEQNISISTCLSSFFVAEKYLCDELIKSTRKFICSNFVTVAETEHFLDLPSREVENWISSDEIVVSVEEDVFEIILKWINHNKSERSLKFSELFRHVRLTCVSRDFLITAVVTNDLVQENKECLDGVVAALGWIDRADDCDVPRPHSPRKSLEKCVIAVCGNEVPSHNLLWDPEKDVFFRLPPAPEMETEDRVSHLCGHLFSCRDKLFVVPANIGKAQCYDPNVNLWIPAPWTKQLDSNLQFVTSESQFLSEVLVVENKICFIVETRRGTGSSSLSLYNLDTDSFVQFIEWLDKIHVCFVAVNRYIYAIGGMIELVSFEGNCDVILRESSRFDTNEDKWEDIAKLQKARYQAFGVGKNQKIFVAGGLGEYWEGHLKTCEVYHIETDEWHLMATLTIPRPCGGMVLVDQTLYVLSRYTPSKTECYRHGKDEWIVQTLPFQLGSSSACSFRLFKGDLYKLERKRFEISFPPVTSVR